MRRPAKGFATLFGALAGAAKLQMREVEALQIANTARASAMSGQLDDKLFATLASAAELQMSAFSAQNIARKGGALAMLG